MSNKQTDDNKVSSGLEHGKRRGKMSSILLGKRKQALVILRKTIWQQQTRSMASLRPTKIRTLLVSFNLLLLTCILVEAGFWTFYLPNFLKPNGYKEITGMIEAVESDMNSTKDNFADAQYFWGLMKQYDNLDASLMYPGDSACSEMFPLFRDMAIEYAHIDYELYMKPMEQYSKFLIESRAKWYPEGVKSKTILPRRWEQKIFEADLESKIFWYEKLANDDDYRKRREKMVNLWNSVKRSLDSSLACLYLRYSYRQVSEDINQLALEMNLKKMEKAMELLKSAYARIDKFKGSDERAEQKIEEDIEKEKRSEMKSLE